VGVRDCLAQAAADEGTELVESGLGHGKGYRSRLRRDAQELVDLFHFCGGGEMDDYDFEEDDAMACWFGSCNRRGHQPSYVFQHIRKADAERPGERGQGLQARFGLARLQQTASGMKPEAHSCTGTWATLHT
jgi:hypothetical protein